MNLKGFMLVAGVAVLMGGVLWFSLPKTVGADENSPPKAVDAAEVSKFDKESGPCPQYVQHAEWKFRDNQYSLVITPTACGRAIEDDNTAHFFDELVRDYADPVYWKNTHGLRHQLICHFIVARDKPTWNLEPWRPDVGLTKTLEGSAEFGGACNPADPLPYDTP